MVVGAGQQAVQDVRQLAQLARVVAAQALRRSLFPAVSQLTVKARLNNGRSRSTSICTNSRSPTCGILLKGIVRPSSDFERQTGLPPLSTTSAYSPEPIREKRGSGNSAGRRKRPRASRSEAASSAYT